MKRLLVLASGRGSNAMALHRATLAGGVLHNLARLSALVCDVPGAPVVRWAEGVGLPVQVIASQGLTRERWEAALLRTVVAPDLWLLAGFRRILSPEFVRRQRGRLLNVHPADSRQYRGLHGYRWAFAQGLAQTWITVHEVDEGVDTGPVLARAAVDLRGADSLDEVERRGLLVEHELYAQVVARVLRGELSACAASSP